MSNQITAYINTLDTPLRETAQALRATIDDALPGAHSAMWHGHPVWGLGDRAGQTPVALIKAYKSYVTFGLWRGQEITDPSGRLQPGARQMASVKLADIEDIDTHMFTTWLTQARALEQ
ncbi:DUF1801 domain-containing protein [Kibdelosporangium persicum]|uniref:YdhG-like domain-containing protein n=1 Tax=Kibdelosporangium persicum TaxID=2698649 RepID=A0ABX2F3B3_9PSEU|nr:DUF1801 domain-containing protein [Kibdelosporangium persicum]NRN65824.1 hypothetical protein [Kibdelosporangium persicum]